MNDTLISSILNSIVNAFLEALKPRIDEIVNQKIKSLPDPLNGSYVTAEEFNEYLRKLEDAEEKSGVKFNNDWIVRIEESISRIESQIGDAHLDEIETKAEEAMEKARDVESQIENLDIDDQISEALNNHDFSDDIENAIDRHDFSSDIESAVDDAIRDHDFSDDVNDAVTSALEDSKFVSEGDVLEIVNRRLHKIGEILIDPANAVQSEQI